MTMEFRVAATPLRRPMMHGWPGWVHQLGALAVLVAVVAGLGGCGSSAPSGAWPNAGATRAALGDRYGYKFERLGNHWRMQTSDLTLLIDLPYQDNYVNDTAVAVFDSSFDRFQTDIENVFTVIAPEALTWERRMLDRARQTDAVDDKLVVAGGVISFSWDKSIPVLTFGFSGNALPRQSQ
jgi:hypothetical protein